MGDMQAPQITVLPPLNHAAAPAPLPIRPMGLLGIAATTILAGALVGASTNAINGAVSPTYFVNIMGWHGVANVWRASIAEGILEGLVFGVFFALVFTATVGIVTKATCTYAAGVRCLLAILLAVYACWAAGGLIAMGLASFSPEFYRRAFVGVPEDFGQMLRYAWVGGSIWGVEFGGLLSVVIGLVIFSARWRRRTTPVPVQP